MWFRDRRKQLHLTLRDVAESLGTTITTVGNWERGYCRPGLSRIDELSAVYQVNAEVIISHIAKLAQSNPGKKSGRPRGLTGRDRKRSLSD